MSKRVYLPTETHLALHPPRQIKTCINPDCHTRFAARPAIDSEDENPDLCLACNRKGWSRLWNSNKPLESIEPTAKIPETSTVQSSSMELQLSSTEFDLVSDDSDIGEVVPIRRPRR